MTREEQQLIAQLQRLRTVFSAAEPTIQRAILDQINTLLYDLGRSRCTLYVPRYVATGGEIFDQEKQQFVRVEDIDPETILPSIY